MKSLDFPHQDTSFSSSMNAEEPEEDAVCERCGAPATLLAGDEPICENCWQLAGACCSGE